MDAAQEVLADEEPLQADVEEAYDALYDALTNLDLVADTSKLQAVVNQAESIDLADYLEDGQDAFLEALDAAKDVLENLDATQAEVDEAAETLNRAMAALRKSRPAKSCKSSSTRQSRSTWTNTPTGARQACKQPCASQRRSLQTPTRARKSLPPPTTRCRRHGTAL